MNKLSVIAPAVVFAFAAPVFAAETNLIVAHGGTAVRHGGAEPIDKSLYLLKRASNSDAACTYRPPVQVDVVKIEAAPICKPKEAAHAHTARK